MQRALRHGCAYAIMVAVLVASRAEAQPHTDSVQDEPPPEDTHSDGADEVAPKSYQEEIDRAVDEHWRGNFQEAREHFRTAHELFPNARTLRGLGKVEFELRNYGESLRYLEAALASEVRPLSIELRDEVERIVEQARAYVGEVRVAIEPDSATVSVDGVVVGSGPRANLALVVGDHVLEFRASGAMPERRHVQVRGRELVVINVVLTPVASDNRRELAGDSNGRRVIRKWWFWTALSAAAAVVTTSVVLSRRERGPTTRELVPPSSDWVTRVP